MSRAETGLLIHRLQEMAAIHERLEDEDGCADTADTLSVFWAREDALCPGLLREAVTALANPG